MVWQSTGWGLCTAGELKKDKRPGSEPGSEPGDGLKLAEKKELLNISACN